MNWGISHYLISCRYVLNQETLKIFFNSQMKHIIMISLEDEGILPGHHGIRIYYFRKNRIP